MNDRERLCYCGLHRIPIGVDGVNWYWTRHSEFECTVSADGLEKCVCGLPKALHWNGHAPTWRGSQVKTYIEEALPNA